MHNKIQAFASIGQHTATCANCVLPELCLRGGLPPEDVERLDHLVYTRRKVTHGEDLYRAGDPFSGIYAIRSGFFKSELVHKDGRSQVMGFHMPGEIMGMDGISADSYPCNAVSLQDAEVCVIPLSRIEEIPHEIRDLTHRLYQIMSKEIVREQRVMVLLGGKTAEARLAAFLVNLSRRYAARGYSPSDLELPMTREEIGSFLGLKLETVSRIFSKIQERKAIEVHQRHIRILDMASLERLI